VDKKRGRPSQSKFQSIYPANSNRKIPIPIVEKSQFSAFKNGEFPIYPFRTLCIEKSSTIT